MGGSRDALAFMTSSDLCGPLEQSFPAREHGALIGSPGTDLAAAGAGSEIHVCFRLADPFYVALYTHLSSELLPVKGKGGTGIGFERTAFSGMEVRVEYEATGVAILEQDDAPIRITVIAHTGQASGLRYLDTSSHPRDLEPPVELLERIGIQFFRL
tara:strand:- start:406 stop:876 length:471 start_codon:yes stop_codon:yes gene_type:complete